MVIHVLPSSSLTHHFKLLWLPPLFPDARIHHFLSKHSAHHQFTRDFVSTDINTSTPSNSVSGTLELSSPDSLSRIPHLIPLPSPHLGSALLILSGRPSLCLKCGTTGHIRRFCSSPRCHKCHRFHSTTSVCPSSNDFSSSSTPWMDLDPDFMPDSHISDSLHTIEAQCDRTPTLSSLILQSSSSTVIPSPSSLIDVVPTDNLHDQPSPPQVSLLPIHHASTVTSDSSYVIAKRVTHSMTSSKRTFPKTSQPSASSDDMCHHNTFNALLDEANFSPTADKSLDSSLLISQSSDNLLSSIAHKPTAITTKLLNSNATIALVRSSDIPAHTTLASVVDVISSGVDELSSLPSIKRVKLCASELATSKSPLTDSALPLSSTSWADQAEMEFGKQDVLEPLPISSSLDQPHISSPNTSIASHTNTNPSHVLLSVDSASSDSDSYEDIDPLETAARNLPRFPDKSLDHHLHVFFAGFPIDSHRISLLLFLDPIMPISLWHVEGPKKDFIGQFGASFSSREDADLAISKSGTIFKKVPIFVSHFKRPKPVADKQKEK